MSIGFFEKVFKISHTEDTWVCPECQTVLDRCSSHTLCNGISFYCGMAYHYIMMDGHMIEPFTKNGYDLLLNNKIKLQYCGESYQDMIKKLKLASIML